MGVLAILIYIVVVVGVGSIVLAAIPQFRVTGFNLFVFTIGAFFGTFGLGNLIVRVLEDFEFRHNTPMGQRDELGIILALFTGSIGGTMLVYVKTALINALEKMIRSRNVNSGGKIPRRWNS